MTIRVTIFFIAIMSVYCNVNAQHVSINAGRWDLGSTWNLGTVPTSTSGTIIVNHAVNIPSGYSVTLDQVTVNATLTIDAGGQITLVDGAGFDLTMAAGSSLVVNGTLIENNLSTISQSGTSTAVFGAASNYRHRYLTTEGVPPTATWNATSNIFIEGFTNTTTLDFASSAWSQSFGNFTYNCTGQRSIVNFNGLITNIKGNLSFLSTGNNVTQLTDSENNVVMSILGNLTISGSSRVNFSVTGIGGIVNLTGNISFTSSNSLGSYLTNSGSFTINVTGDFTMNGGGRIYMAGSLGSTGVGTLNLSKNFSLISGLITEAGSTSSNGNIRFVGSGNFTFVNTGSVGNRVNFYIASTVTLDLSIYPIVAGSSSSFQLEGTIICGSLEPTGAIVNSTTLGNIRTTPTLRTYSTGSKVIYRSTSAQVMGDGQPSAAGVTTVIDNSQGVTLYQAGTGTMTIGGTLQLENGMLFLGLRTLSLTGTINYNTGTLGSNSNSTLTIGGTSGGNFGSLIFDPANNILGILNLSRTGANSAITVNSTLTIVSQLNLGSGNLNNASGLTVANGCIVSKYPASQLLSNRLAHAIGDSYNLLYRTTSATGTSVNFSTGLELPASADATALNNFTINTAQAADILQLSQDFTINGDLTLSRGTFIANSFTITMQGNNWIDGAGNLSAGTGLVIFNGVTTVGGTSSTAFNSIQLNAGKSLTLARATSIAGNIDFSATGTFNPGTNNVTLNGGTLQTVSAGGADFFNIIISKAGGSDVQLTSAMDLIGLLSFISPSANCDIQSNGFLRLVSTSDGPGTALAPGTAQIYKLLSGNTISGNVIVERYMSGEGRIYRYLSSPVSNASVASWKDDFPITGHFSDPSSGPSVCGTALKPTTPSMYYYNESLPGNEDAGYVAFPSSGTAASNPLVVGRGYSPFVRECTNPTVVDVTGVVNQGQITFGITYTNTGNGVADGYNLLGNPYPCTVDWDVAWVKTRVSPIIAVRDNGNAGAVLYWDGSAGTLPNGLIAPGQGFFVRATSANPILRVTENSKVNTPSASGEFFRKASGPSYLSISLSDGKLSDKVFVKLRSESFNTLDDWDAPKLNNELFDLYVLSEDHIPMAIDSRNTIQSSNIIELGLKDISKGTYKLKLDEMTGEFNDFKYILIDNYTNKRITFTNDYQFDIDDNLLSSEKNRFRLLLTDKSEVLVSDHADELVYPNPVERFLYINNSDIVLEHISVLDNLGKSKLIKPILSDGLISLDFEDIASGLYYVHFINDGMPRIYKIFKK